MTPSTCKEHYPVWSPLTSPQPLTGGKETLPAFLQAKTQPLHTALCRPVLVSELRPAEGPGGPCLLAGWGPCCCCDLPASWLH